MWSKLLACYGLGQASSLPHIRRIPRGARRNLSKLESQARFGVGPVVFGGGEGDAEGVSHLGHGHADEEAELDDGRGARIGLFELGEGVVEGEKVEVGLFGRRFD